MTTDPATINRIVSEVLKRIGTFPQPVRKQNGVIHKQQKIIAERVITEGLLQSLTGQQQLQFQTDAIITPAARDYLKEQNICWSRECDSSVISTQSQAEKLIIAVQVTPVVRSVLEDLKQNQATQNWKLELVGCVGEAEKLAVSSLCRAEVDHVIVICRETYELTCKANRNSKVRAAAVGDLAALLEARSQITTNLIAVNPTNMSFFALRNLVQKSGSN